MNGDDVILNVRMVMWLFGTTVHADVSSSMITDDSRTRKPCASDGSADRDIATLNAFKHSNKE